MNGITVNDIQEFSRYLIVFLFILLRTSLFVALLPVIGRKELPPQFKIGLAVFIAILLTPVIQLNIYEDQIPLLVIKEAFIGITLGFTARIVFFAVNIAGIFVSHTMGLSMGRVFNPEVGHSTFIAEVYGIMAILIFLITDAHHDMIFIFVKSFELLPGGSFDVVSVLPDIISMVSKMFTIALKLAAPVLVGLLIAHILPGFLYKVAPRLNIFFIVLPLNIFLGLLLIMISIPVFDNVVDINFSNLRSEMARVIMLAHEK